MIVQPQTIKIPRPNKIAMAPEVLGAKRLVDAMSNIHMHNFHQQNIVIRTTYSA